MTLSHSPVGSIWLTADGTRRVTLPMIRVRLRDFLLATALGMSPGIFIVVVLQDQLERTLRDPTIGTVALLIALAIFFAVLGTTFYRWYAQRPSTRRLTLGLRPTSRPNDAHRSVI